jgi:two-component system nitrate/nitrite response regulator NarL
VNATEAISVVLADDDAAFLSSLRALIDDEDGLWVAATATDGVEAIEFVKQLQPDALVIDLHMPRLDGVSAIARLREDHPRLCVIALTGDESREIHLAVAEAGGNAVLLKSEVVDGLAAHLRAAIPLLEPDP